ncbi:MAG: SulP family inorganic anion transporter [Anaerolineae bacterium]
MPASLRYIPGCFLQPLRLSQTYAPQYLRSDLIAGLTVAIILLPQAIAFALIAELPPQMGLYAAIVGAIVAALWGSSNQAHTGPANAISLLVLSVLLTDTTPGTPAFVVAAGMVAVMAGVFQLAMGLARLGVLANFVSHSVVVGFTGGAGVLIAVKQLRYLLGLDFTSRSLAETIQGVAAHISETHDLTLILGVGTILVIVILRRLTPKLPGALLSMVVASAAVFFLGLDKGGVAVIGQLPRSLPPVAQLPLLNLDLIAELATGALAIGAIGLVETMAISRSIATQTGQRLDNNQEFVGQGLANIVAGLLSGYPCAASFSRSAVNHESGARTPMASVFSGLFVLLAMFTLTPLAAYLPRTALAGVLIVTAYGMIDRAEIARIWRGAPGDAAIMLITFLGTLFLHIEFAVLLGILLSLALYIMQTSVPGVHSVLPDDDFRYLIQRPEKPECPQLGILDVHGDLYFGAVNHVEQAIHEHMTSHPEQRLLLLRMHSVNLCDFSGIHMLEGVMHRCRERGGDVFLMRVREPVLHVMESTGFYDYLGADHFLSEEAAVTHLFYKVLDPAICIYECDVRAFKECQNLPKRAYPSGTIPLHTEVPAHTLTSMSAQALWKQIHGTTPPLVIDVREPREFKRGHIIEARLIPLPTLMSDASALPDDRPVVLVCRSGRRSSRAASALNDQGYDNVIILRGGMLAWEAAGLLEAIE